MGLYVLFVCKERKTNEEVKTNMELHMLQLIIIAAIVVLFIVSVKIIPQQQVWISERFGKYSASLQPGLNFVIPFVDRIAYKHTLKERAIEVSEQTAITKDNVTLIMDGIIYVRIVNPASASYGVENPYYAVTQLAQTSMRSAMGKLTMDTTFEERELLNSQIVTIINEAAAAWGIQCMRYEIRDIKPPATVLKAMEMQVAAERQKRAEILASEGKTQSMINIAEGRKIEVVLNSEASMAERINKAKGESEAIQVVATATAESIQVIAKAIKIDGGSEAVSLKLAEQYVEAFKSMAKTNNTLIVPATVSDVGSMVAQALTVFQQIRDKGAKVDEAKEQLQ
ncbi:SPFH/Band 7/PHB domain protein [Alphaproteobacteria bacterium]